MASALDRDLRCWSLPFGVEVMTDSAGISGSSLSSRVITTVGDLSLGDEGLTITDSRLGEGNRIMVAVSSKRTR